MVEELLLPMSWGEVCALPGHPVDSTAGAGLLGAAMQGSVIS